MKEIHAYIESGILELYVMGELGPDDRAEVEMMAEKHPEIRAELTEIEKSLEAYARTRGIEPAGHMRDIVIDSIFPNDTGAIKNLPARSSLSIFRYAFAASVAILLISWSALFILYGRLETAREDIASLQISNQQFAGKVNDVTRQLSEREQMLQILSDPGFRRIKLEGTDKSPSSSMLVVFNPEKRQVLIHMPSLKIPVNDSAHQYQLWALVGGKPVDLGVFDKDTTHQGMKQMKPVDAAQAFAVTLEKQGGSLSPTMDSLMVMGSM